MARTHSGLEFYLVEIVGEPDALGDAQLALEDMVREGDAVFRSDNRLFVAFIGEVTGAGQAARRLLRRLRERGLSVKVRLVAEPFPPLLAKVAAMVITGQIRATERDSSGRLWMRR